MRSAGLASSSSSLNRLAQDRAQGADNPAHASPGQPLTAAGCHQLTTIAANEGGYRAIPEGRQDMRIEVPAIERHRAGLQVPRRHRHPGVRVDPERLRIRRWLEAEIATRETLANSFRDALRRVFVPDALRFAVAAVAQQHVDGQGRLRGSRRAVRKPAATAESETGRDAGGPETGLRLHLEPVYPQEAKL